MKNNFCRTSLQIIMILLGSSSYLLSILQSVSQRKTMQEMQQLLLWLGWPQKQRFYFGGNSFNATSPTSLDQFPTFDFKFSCLPKNTLYLVAHFSSTFYNCTYQVLRDGKWSEEDAAVLVPGDIISIKLGDIIPADARLLEGDPLKIDQVFIPYTYK